MEETKKLKPLSVREIRAALRTVLRWIWSAQYWASRDQVTLNEMALNRAYWFGRIEKEDQVLLIAVKTEEVAWMFESLLASMPEEAVPPMMEVCIGWMEMVARRNLAKLTPEQVEEAKARAVVAATEKIAGLTLPP